MSDAYRRRVGRWCRDVIAQSKDPVFWIVVGIARECHKPTDAIMSACNKYSLRGEISISDRGYAGGILFQFVNGLADEIARGFDNQLDTSTNWAALLADAPRELFDKLNQCIALLVLHHSSGFERKFHCSLRRLLK